MIALQPSPAADFLDRAGPAIDAAFGRPRAVIVVSPHTATREPVVFAAARHEAVHDFGGFPQALYELRYDVPGEPALAADVARRLGAAGLPVHLSDESGIDHGIWTVLRRMWPQAEVPVVPLSLVPFWSPRQQWAVGQALAPLRDEGVLIIGSGSLTHNLRRFFGLRGREPGTVVEPDVQAFREWVLERSAAQDWDALFDYRRQAPHAEAQHPTDEHWLPFYVAAGAGAGQGASSPGVRVHASVDAGILAMDGYAFGEGADELARQLV